MKIYSLKENNEELNTYCLKILTFLFKNGITFDFLGYLLKNYYLLEKSAIKLLKTRIVSNLIIHILKRNDKVYERYIVEIIETAIKMESREILLTYSKDFEPEIKNLKNIIVSKDFQSKKIIEKLEIFLK